MYKNNLIKKGSSVAKELESQQNMCKDEIARSPNDDMKIQYDSCERVLTRILELTADTTKGECYNMYDVRLKDTLPSCGMNWPPDLKYVTPYLQRQDVMRALHVNEDHQPGWTECNSRVGLAFHPQHSQPAIYLMPDILAEIKVLLFSGDKDLICNHMGTEELIHNMQWNGGKGFEISPNTWAPRKDWVFEGESAGIYQEARNLTYVLFYNSSHMVPFDYPRRTRDMLDRFMEVDIGNVGGKPAESLLDGTKNPTTSVGGIGNNTVEEEEEKKLENERWSAYYRAGAVALVVVAILALCFGWYVWQDRRRRAGYGPINWMQGRTGMGLRRPDLEATDFDEGELDDLASPEDREAEHRYSLGGVSSDEEEELNGKLNGHTNGHSK
jgi:carboxypeptidase D